MNIAVSVKEPRFWETGDVNVVANGLCNHADYEIREEEDCDEYTEAVTGIAQPVYRYNVYVCNNPKCEAWRYEDDSEWHDANFIEDEEDDD